jgi:Xaa-Pro aminopeptidase
MVVKKAEAIKSPLKRDFCEFETITMVPIYQKLIDTSLLTKEEILWLNEYHQQVATKLGPLLKDDAAALAYLKRETAPIAMT